MAVYKEEKTNTWRVIYRYTDWNGARRQTPKRGFKTKREALAWEREQLSKMNADLDMTFESFVSLYAADVRARLKENTWSTKEHIFRTKLQAVPLIFLHTGNKIKCRHEHFFSAKESTHLLIK